MSDLNKNQRDAVEWGDGNLLVLAGPGSGKTLVLTQRVARLVAAPENRAVRILGLTFTNKAAAEMRERVRELAADVDERCLLATFHSFCVDVLRQHGNHVKVSPAFTILPQDDDRKAVLRDAIEALRSEGAEPGEGDEDLLGLIDRQMADLVEPAQVAGQIQDPDLGARVARLYERYLGILLRDQRLDFAAILLLVNRLFTRKPAIAAQYRGVYRHVCVDEFQDTNFAQYAILKHLVGPETRSLFVVADDDQIVYQWNGANPERLRALRADYGMRVIQLPQSYRCPAEVIELANNLISHNSERTPGKKPLEATAPEGEGEAVRVEQFEDAEAEARWIARDIRGAADRDAGSSVLLARTRRVLTEAIETINGEGLDAQIVAARAEFLSSPLRWLHALLRLSQAPVSREQLRRVCKAFFELEGVDVRVEDVVGASAETGGDLLRWWARWIAMQKGTPTELRKFLKLVEDRLVERKDFRAVIDAGFARYDSAQAKGDREGREAFADYEGEAQVWRAHQRDIEEARGKDLPLSEFLQEMDLRSKAPPVPAGALRCMTIHTAKGLEFDHVYLAGLAEDVLPSFQAIRKGPTSREMQEERRSCFVAITRAKRSLTLTFAAKYFGWPKKPSRFLAEMAEKA